jgi:hypothetical protein
VLTNTTGYDPSNTSAAPTFLKQYFNGDRRHAYQQTELVTAIQVPASFNEGGNFIRPQFGPLSLQDPIAADHPFLSDYHVSSGVGGQALNIAYGGLLGVPATLAFDFDGDPRPTSGASLPHRGADQAPPEYTVSPTALSFGTQQVLVTSAAQTVTVTNTGTVAFAVGATLSGTNPGQFAQANSCGASLAPAASCQISVTFTPTSQGAKSATLNVNVTGAASQSVALSGTGLLGTFTVAPAPLAFGNQQTNTTGSQALTVTNTGTGPLTVSNTLTLGGANPLQFGRTSACTSALPPGGTCQITVTFTPTSTGLKNATLTVPAAGAVSQVVALSGTGVPPTFTVTPGSHAFGSQTLGTTSAAQAITVSNTGSGPMPVAISLTDAVQFGQTNNCGTSLAAGASCVVSLVFHPTTLGAKSGNLNVTVTGASPATVSVAATGTGI